MQKTPRDLLGADKFVHYNAHSHDMSVEQVTAIASGIDADIKLAKVSGARVVCA